MRWFDSFYPSSGATDRWNSTKNSTKIWPNIDFGCCITWKNWSWRKRVMNRNRNRSKILLIQIWIELKKISSKAALTCLLRSRTHHHRKMYQRLVLYCCAASLWLHTASRGMLDVYGAAASITSLLSACTQHHRHYRNVHLMLQWLFGQEEAQGLWCTTHVYNRYLPIIK